MNRTAAVFTTVLTLLTIAALALILWTIMLKPKTPTMAPKLHEYCTAVAIALEQDAKTFEQGTVAEQEKAAGRFGEQVTFHSEYEIALCASRPVNLEQRPMCAIGPNPPCLAKLAREAAAAVREGL